MGLPHHVHQWRHDRDRLREEVQDLNGTISGQKSTISNLKNQIAELEQKVAAKGKILGSYKFDNNVRDCSKRR